MRLTVTEPALITFFLKVIKSFEKDVKKETPKSIKLKVTGPL